MILTDLNQKTLDNTSFNVKANGVEADVMSLDWQDKSTWPKV